MSEKFELPKSVHWVFIAAAMSCAAPASQASWGALLTIVHSTGPRSFSDIQQADLPQIVTIEIRMTSYPIISYWFDIDCANLSNGWGGDLSLAEVSCGVDADCEAVFGVPGSTCVDGLCEAVFVDTTRADFYFAQLNDYGPGTPVQPCQSNGEFTDNSCGPSMGVGATSADMCEPSTASWWYVGTIALEIPADAVGRYEIELSPATRLTSQSGSGEQHVHYIADFDPEARFWTSIRIQSPLPMPVTNPDPEAMPAGRSAGVAFEPQSKEVVPFKVRVMLDSLHHPDPPYSSGPTTDFSGLEGQIRWLGPPVQYVESAANPSTFWASTLQCTPYDMDWTTVSPITILGSEVVPSSTLEVRTYGLECAPGFSCSNRSGPLEISTARWGDVQIPFSTPGGPTQPDLGDAAALVDKFKNLPGALSKVRTKLQPAIPNMAGDVDFSDISMCIDAFKGKPYPFTMQGCP